MSLGSLTFLAPLTLIGLLSLPLIWWLLRVTPPLPKDEVFPPLRILQDVVTEEETPNSTPLWLLIFRLLMVAIIAIALARPIMTKPEGIESRDLTLVIDNGWDAATHWSDIIKDAEARISDARRKNVNVLLLATAEDNTDAKFRPAENAMQRVKTLIPHPFAPNHAGTAKILNSQDITQSEAVWLSGGIDFGAADTLATALRRAANTERLAPTDDMLPLLPGRVEETAQGLRSVWYRTTARTLRTTDITANARDGRTVARGPLSFAPGETVAMAEFELPVELRNRVASLKTVGAGSAGSIKLLDDSWGRPLLGLLTGGDDSGSPLLSESFYAETALSPFADIFEGQLSDLLPLSPSIIVMPDAARIESDALKEFVETGGLLIRFAGPKLAKRRDALLPVTLREGGRALGGALTWQDPQTLAPFAEDSPFFGLTVPDDIRVTRQVMAEPGAETDSRTWARLSDGSPVVTSAPMGYGRIVLFHVTAGPEWSNLAVGGLYVDMLRRILPLAKSETRAPLGGQGDWVAERVLTGFGRLDLPDPQVTSIPESQFTDAIVSRTTPPGLYRQGPRRKALNTLNDPESVSAIGNLPGIREGQYGQTTQRNLGGLLLGLALAALTVDAVLALWISGRLANLKPRKLAPFAAVLLAALIYIPNASAEDVAPPPALGLHFAYVETGDGRMDRMSEAAIRGLVDALTKRTTVEPDGIRGVDLATDDLVFYPFLYFPVSRDAPPLSVAANDALNAYMAGGGTIVFDTQDQGDKALIGTIQHPGLQNVTKALDIPALGQVPEDHVINKSFYLIQSYPGRWANGSVWVDKRRSGAAKDGVSSVIIGANDWSAAWAIAEDGTPLIATLENDIPRQREMATRFGVNLAMYALAGNYKADQVHAAALIERLGGNRQQPQNLKQNQSPSILLDPK